MIELLHECYEQHLLCEKFRIYAKFLNTYGTIAITINGDILIAPTPKVSTKDFMMYKNKFEKDIGICIETSINNN